MTDIRRLLETPPNSRRDNLLQKHKVDQGNAANKGKSDMIDELKNTIDPIDTPAELEEYYKHNPSLRP